MHGMAMRSRAHAVDLSGAALPGGALSLTSHCATGGLASGRASAAAAADLALSCRSSASWAAAGDIATWSDLKGISGVSALSCSD